MSNNFTSGNAGADQFFSSQSINQDDAPICSTYRKDDAPLISNEGKTSAPVHNMDMSDGLGVANDDMNDGLGVANDDMNDGLGVANDDMNGGFPVITNDMSGSLPVITNEGKARAPLATNEGRTGASSTQYVGEGRRSPTYCVGETADNMKPSRGIDGRTLQTYNFGVMPVRVFQKNSEAWFAAADVCAALDIVNPRHAVTRLDDDERALVPCDTPVGKRAIAAVSEAGMYSLILTSRKDEAKTFKRWITHVVLPSIRKTGKYEEPPANKKGRGAYRKRRSGDPQYKLLPNGRREITSRDDLSFVQRDDMGRLVNWVPRNPGFDWGSCYATGAYWFGEIVELNRHSPEEAFEAMYFAGLGMARDKLCTDGHTLGFFGEMARWAVAGMLAHPFEDPVLPFTPPGLGQASEEAVAFLTQVLRRSSRRLLEQAA